MWQGTEKHYHNSSNFRLQFSEWRENQLALAKAVDDTAMCQGSSWRRQANHRQLEHSAYSESLWWIRPSLQAGSTGGTVCWEWQGHRTGTGTHHLYPEHKTHPHSCQVGSEYNLQSGQSYLLLFVSFCCIHLYFMFIAVSYQMFFHWCSFMYPHWGFRKKRLDSITCKTLGTKYLTGKNRHNEGLFLMCCL